MIRGAILICVILATGCTTAVRRASDDYRDRDVSVWLHTPFVAAGDTLVLEIGAFDDPEVGIGAVQVFLGDDLVASTFGRGVHWGSSIVSSNNSILWEASDFVWIRIPVPRGRTSLPIRVEADYTSVLALGQSFSNLPEHASIRFEVPVRSPAARMLRRLATFGVALASLLLVCLLLWRKYDAFAAFVGRESAHQGGGLLLVLLFAWLALGYWWFSARLMVALGSQSGWLRAVGTLSWLVTPPLVAAALHRRRRLPRAVARPADDATSRGR